jgi:uncharacterized protein (UPF0332 family)
VNEEVADLWTRARRALQTGESLIESDPDAAASRACYAAFYGVSALFAFEGKTFGKHSAVESAVHRDLVRVGKITPEVGGAYSALVDLRNTGDYGGKAHVGSEAAHEAVKKARVVLNAVRQVSPEPLPPVDV